MNTEQQKRLADAPELYRGWIRRAYEQKAAPRQAIKAFCLQCTGYMRKDVAGCTALGCPLWMYRPYQHGEDEDGEEAAT